MVECRARGRAQEKEGDPVSEGRTEGTNQKEESRGEGEEVRGEEAIRANMTAKQ